MADKAYTITALAERWACSRDVLYDMIRKGELKCFRVGRAVRISAAEVERKEAETTTV